MEAEVWLSPGHQAETGARAAVAAALDSHPERKRVDVQVEVIEGATTEVLVSVSRGARLLVVGSRSRSELEGMVFGSVALHCVVRAGCPVMVVHPRTASATAKPLAAAGGRGGG
jgi:nucleotide-binding universal stress UspA family protein